MQKAQMITQKIVIFGALALAVLTLVYALGFSTNLYSLSYHADQSSGLFYVPGAELYKTVQPFNRELFRQAVAFLCVSLTMFITLTHRRRLYYPANYVTSLGFTGYAVYLARLLWLNCADYKTQYLAVDFEKLEKITKMMKLKYVESTFMLDVGMVLAAALGLWAALLVINLVMKSIWMSREKWLKTESLGVAEVGLNGN